MFSKVLVANRGEIAVRIIRSLRELGIKTVAIYSTADRESLHVQLADEAVCVGTARAQDSYLNAKNILEAALGTGAQAIHPGFGFLSENAEFATMCEECGITFIGPQASVIDLMGNKEHAREQMKKSGVPVIPGSDDYITNVNDAVEVANKIGYPILLKAAAGGGGKGSDELMIITRCGKYLAMPKMKPVFRLMMTECTLKRSWRMLNILRSKSFVIILAMLFSFLNETARFNGINKN